MKAVLETVEDWARSGEGVAIATVVETKKSAPQPPGTKMAVNAVGEVTGAVSGGCVEGAVVVVAEQVIGGLEPQLLHYGIADEEAWDVGLPCGGEISVWVERYQPDGPQARFAQLVRDGGRAAIATVVEGSVQLGAKLLVVADQPDVGTLGDAALDREAVLLAREALWTERSGLHQLGDASVFVDVTAPPPRLIVVGAVDFAAQLTAAAAFAGWRTFVVDPRSRFATAERFPAAERVLVGWPREAFAELKPFDRATAIAVLTHDPKLDDAALTSALDSDAGYIGAMGSRRAQERRRARLLEAGVTAEQLERVAAPIGLDLGALTAAETALSIMSEIVALRNGHEGGRLVSGLGRIHEAVGA